MFRNTTYKRETACIIQQFQFVMDAVLEVFHRNNNQLSLFDISVTESGLLFIVSIIDPKDPYRLQGPQLFIPVPNAVLRTNSKQEVFELLSDTFSATIDQIEQSLTSRDTIQPIRIDDYIPGELPIEEDKPDDPDNYTNRTIH